MGNELACDGIAGIGRINKFRDLGGERERVSARDFAHYGEALTGHEAGGD